MDDILRMDPNSSAKSTFRLFDLPRELRDEIYSYLHREVRVKCSTDSLMAPPSIPGAIKLRPMPISRASLHRGPLLGIQLVSKQLRTEYVECISKSMWLITAMAPHCHEWSYPDVPAQLRHLVRNCVSYLPLVCEDCDADDNPKYSCGTVRRLTGHQPELERWLTQFPNLGTMHVKIGVIWARRNTNFPLWPPTAHPAGLDAVLGSIVDTEPVKELKVVLCAYRRRYNAYCDAKISRKPAVLLTWTTADKWRKGEAMLPYAAPGCYNRALFQEASCETGNIGRCDSDHSDRDEEAEEDFEARKEWMESWFAESTRNLPAPRRLFRLRPAHG